MSAGEEFYEIERITRKEIRPSGVFYLVKWRGFPRAESSWLHISELVYAKAAIEEYEANLREEELIYSHFAAVEEKKAEEKTTWKVAGVRENEGELVWMVENRRGEVKEIGMEEARQKLPIEVIDFLVTKLKFT